MKMSNGIYLPDGIYFVGFDGKKQLVNIFRKRIPETKLLLL